MKIQTRHFGLLDIAETDLLQFPEGIVGFEEHDRFILLTKPEEEPFVWLQSTSQPEAAFIMIDPHLFSPEYSIEVDDETADMLNVRDPSTVKVMAIVTMSSDTAKITANLLAPVILNLDGKKGRQIVLHGSTHSTRHPIFSRPSSTEQP